jgi:murein DD-endopeptidase MepM/ murein hydrolase activator NlpD
MNGLSGFLVLFLLTPLVAFPEEKVHIVEKGDTVYSIARSYGVDRDELMKFNGIDDVQKLQIGRRLKIPSGAASGELSSPGTAGFVEYRAAKGDTLYSIARRHGVVLGSILSANGLPENYILKAGDLLRIPLPPAAGGDSSGVSGPAADRSGTAVKEAAVPRAVAAKETDASIRWPVEAKEVTYMTGKLYGVVLMGERSEPVKGLIQGTVVSAGPYRGFGKVAIVQVTGGYLYVYGGCESLSVKEGDRVGPGSELGKLGIDAVSGKPQLFFLVYRNNTPMDPAKAPRA